MLLFALTLLLSALVSLYVAPLLIAAAHRYGILDKGDGHLKHQQAPVAYLGGLAVFVGMLVALSFTQSFDSRMLALLLGASLVVSVGIIDDLGTLTPKDKLLGQILAAAVLVKGGVGINLTVVPWYVADIASVLWVVSLINAFNIIDVSDGLCSGVGAVVALELGVWCLLKGDVAEAFLAAALCGGLLGFLRYNWSPARMYLGDTGSMLVGMVVAAIALVGDYSRVNDVAPLVAPLAVLVVPLFDLTFVMVVRMHLRLRVYHGSPDHFAVRLKRYGWSAPGVVYLAAAVSAAGGGAALVAVSVDAWSALVVGTVGALGCLMLGVLLWRLDPRAVRQPQQPQLDLTQDGGQAAKTPSRRMEEDVHS